MEYNEMHQFKLCRHRGHSKPMQQLLHAVGESMASNSRYVKSFGIM